MSWACIFSLVLNPQSQPTNHSHQREPRTPKTSSSDILSLSLLTLYSHLHPFFRLNLLLAVNPNFPSTSQNSVFKVQLTCHLLQEASPTSSLFCLNATWLGLFYSGACHTFQLHMWAHSHNQACMCTYARAYAHGWACLLTSPQASLNFLNKLMSTLRPRAPSSILLCLPHLQMAKEGGGGEVG